MSDALMTEWIFSVYAPKRGGGPIKVLVENPIGKDASFARLLAKLIEVWLAARRGRHA